MRSCKMSCKGTEKSSHFRVFAFSHEKEERESGEKREKKYKEKIL